MDIGSQPARDVGLSKREIPAILQTAYGAPYSLKALDNCAALETEIIAVCRSGSSPQTRGDPERRLGPTSALSGR